MYLALVLLLHIVVSLTCTVWSNSSTFKFDKATCCQLTTLKRQTLPPVYSNTHSQPTQNPDQVVRIL
jgi:hypothetical protein